MVVDEVYEAFDLSNEIAVYRDGNKQIFSDDSKEFKSILAAWNEMIEHSYQMPAFGVSLDGETRKAVLCGNWIEFGFREVFYCNEMPFEKLLVQVVDDFEGFNLIRYNSAYGYDGRCYYINLNHRNMRKFSQSLASICLFE